MKTRSVSILLFIAILGLSCTENTENLVAAPDDEENNEPIEQISFSEDIQPILSNNCAGCHGASGGVNLSSYSQLMSSVGNNYGDNVVVPGNADASGLVDKIEPSPQFGARMPTNGSLTPTEIQTIRAWINEGALNN